MDGRQRLANLLRVCSRNAFLKQGMQVHQAVLNMGLAHDPMLNIDLINMYGKCGKKDMSRAVFDEMRERNVVSWTALMCGYLQNGDAKGCLALFPQMVSSGTRPNEFTLSTALKASGMISALKDGMEIHGACIKEGWSSVCVVANCLIDMYAKCGTIGNAARGFDEMLYRNLISWNVMIAGYAHVEEGKKALILFKEMQKMGEDPDEYTYASTLKASSDLGAMREGTQIHGFLITNGFPISDRAVVASALVNLYVKCGHLSQARRVFEQTEEKKIVSWSALILGYAQDENMEDAMDLFRQLRESSIQMDGFVLSGMISVFADYAFAEQGKQMHAYTVKVPCGLDISVANSILDMYLKCGLIDEAADYFADMPLRNVVSWTAMITGYGKHGLGNEAVKFFHDMQLDDIQPDSVSYLAVLSSCSHSGLVEESRQLFSRLCADQNIEPQVEHYACMVDVLGRAGLVEEAKSVIDTMPLKPNEGIWQTLLSACKVHGYLEMGQKVGEILVRMDSSNPANYVMMSNLYLDAGHWNESERVRQVVKRKKLKKVGGCSWVEIDKKVHYFYSGADSHPLAPRIHDALTVIEKRMKEEIGYTCKVSFVLHDVDEESKEESLRVHSEKLAIGLVLVSGGLGQEGKVVHIFKNLRVCGDCHEFIKGLTRILKVVFIVRDASRFHRFQDGVCSCRDYW